MSLIDYSEILATVQTLLADVGRDITLEKMDATPSDADMPWKGPTTPAAALSQAARGVAVPPSGEALGRELVSPEMLATVEQVFLVAPITDVTMEQFNAVQDDGLRWRIQWVYTLRPGSVALLHVFGVCR